MKKLAIILTAFAVSLSAGSFTIQDEARVTHSKPIYKTVTKKSLTKSVGMSKYQ